MELVLAANLLVGFCEKCRIIPFISPIQLLSHSFCFAVSLKNANCGSWLHPFLRRLHGLFLSSSVLCFTLSPVV